MLTADFCFLTLGGALKRKEIISGRMGDILSEMYILSAALKRWEDEGRQAADLPVLHYAAAEAFRRIQTALDEVIANLPARWAAGVLRILTLPGRNRRGADDRLTEACCNLIYEPSASRDRITGRVFEGCARDGVEVLNECYAKVVEMAPVMKRLRDVNMTPAEGREARILTEAEMSGIDAMNAMVAQVIAVDDFTPDALAGLFPDMDGGRARSRQGRQGQARKTQQ